MSSSDDEDGGADVLVRLGGALARANRNDEAATALHKALSIMGRGSDEAFKARENFMVVVNRLFQPLHGFRALHDSTFLAELQAAIEAAKPQCVLDLGSGNSACWAAMCSVRAGASRVFCYDSLRIRCDVVKEVLAANAMSRKVAVIRSDITEQDSATDQQRERPADTMLIDVTGYFGIDLFNGGLLPSVQRALTGGFLAPGASIVPCEIRLVACVIESASIRELEEVMGLVDGFELASFNRFSRDTRGVQLSTYEHKLLAGPCPVLSISLAEWGGQADVACELDAVASGGVDALVYWYETRAHPGAGWHSRAGAGEFAWIVGQGRGAGGGGNVMEGQGVRVCVRIDEGGMLLGLGDGASDEGVVGSAEIEDGREDPFTQCAGIPLYHFSMVNDQDRAAAYSAALNAAMAVAPDGCITLDIGCGSGLLSLMAARAGTGHVFACDKAPGMAECAAKVVSDNDMSSRITIFDALSTSLSVRAVVAGENGGAGVCEALSMPARAHVLVSETFGDDPFSESFLPSLAHAREHLIEPSAVIVPNGITVYAVIVESSELRAVHSIEPGGKGEGAGFEVCAWECFGRERWSVRVDDADVTYLTDPFPAISLDWRENTPPMEAQRPAVDVSVTHGGKADAVVFWYTLDMGGGGELSTAPGAAAAKGRHWRQAVYFLGGGCAVERGDKISVIAGYNRDRATFKVERMP